MSNALRLVQAPPPIPHPPHQLLLRGMQVELYEVSSDLIGDDNDGEVQLRRGRLVWRKGLTHRGVAQVILHELAHVWLNDVAQMLSEPVVEVLCESIANNLLATVQDNPALLHYLFEVSRHDDFPAVPDNTVAGNSDGAGGQSGETSGGMADNI